jgi:putative spermidine/putrescine transport system permease protein
VRPVTFTALRTCVSAASKARGGAEAQAVPRSLWLALPLALLLAVFFVTPVAHMAILSLHPAVPGSDTAAAGWSAANYLRFWSDPYFCATAFRTLWLSALTCLITVVLGYPTALIIARGSAVQRRLLSLLVIMPLLVNVVVRAFGWRIILGRNGILNRALLDAGLIGAPLPILYNEFAVVIGSVHVFFALMVLPLASAIDRIDASLGGAATTLGAGVFRTFLTVTLPLTTQGLAVGLTLVFSLTASSFVIPSLLGGRTVAMLGNTMEGQILSVFDWSFGATIAMNMVVLIIGFTALAAFVLPRTGRRSR